MRIIPFIIIAVFMCIFQSWACVGPANIEGVAFTSGETINLQNLMNLGSENVNYIKEGDTPNVGIRYKSHFDPRAMVFIGNYGMSFQQNVSMACMGIIFPHLDSVNKFSPIAKETFDFAAALKTELAWLVSKNIIAISSATIAKIDSVLKTSGNGGVQYWTHADKTLSYDSWYEKDGLSGVWSVSGVNGVRSLDAVEGCSVVKPGSGLPPQGIGTVGIAAKPAVILKGSQSLAVRVLGNGGLVVFFPQMQNNASEHLIVMDCKGAIVRTKQVPAGLRSMYISGLAFSHYTARLQK
jgi:hypothetical protein